MKRLIIVSYYFPPDGGAGTQRAAKFCKYLPTFGWTPVVVTRAGDSGGRWAPPDPSLTADIGPCTQVIRVAVPDRRSGPARCGPCVDRCQPWVGSAYEQVAEIVRSWGADAVLITMSPFSLAHLGNALVRDSHVPVVLDLRDPWALDGWPMYPTRWHWLRDRRLMRRSLAGAAGVVMNTPEARRAVLEDVRGLDPDRVTAIPNGFDADDLGRWEPHDRDGRFLIVHAGSLHSYVLYPSRRLSDRVKRLVKYRPEPIRPEGRTLYYLLRAIQRLRAVGHPVGERALVTLVGDVDDQTRQSIRDAGMESAVQLLGYLPHKESVRWLSRADALFLPLHGLPAGRRSRIVPGKTYEYLAAGRPILGCLPAGDARDLVQACGGFCADPCDPEEIAAALERIHDSAADRPRAVPQPDWLTRFERRSLTGHLAMFLTRITGT